jgi:hypothetical protein
MLSLINRLSFGMIAALLGLLRPMPLVDRPMFPPMPSFFGSAPRRPRRLSRLYAPNGARECARRRRQIELGQLRVSA